MQTALPNPRYLSAWPCDGEPRRAARPAAVAPVGGEERERERAREKEGGMVPG